MTNILLGTVIFLQLVSIGLSFLRNTPNLEILKKDLLILEKNMEVMRNQMVLIITKSNLDSNRISMLESIVSKQLKPNKSDTNFH